MRLFYLASAGHRLPSWYGLEIEEVALRSAASAACIQPVFNQYYGSAGFYSHEGPCLFVLKKGSVCLYVAGFVDDLVVTGSSEAAIEAFKEQMHCHVEIKDLGTLVWCLGVKIEQDLVAGMVSLS